MPSINPNIRIKKRSLRSPDYYLNGILSSDRYVLGETITLVESTTKEERAIANEVLRRCYKAHRSSQRIAITGAPGVGKSTLIEALGSHYIQNGYKVAVLAVDPSSGKSKGSILGDKTRMTTLSTMNQAYVRPSAAGTTLGGTAQYTKEALVLCEAAGYDKVIIETVGVGQSETIVHGLVDIMLLLLLPGAGDEVQGIKRGIMELADLLIVNKADPDRKALTEETLRSYRNAMQLLGASRHQWKPPVISTSALHQTGISNIIEHVNKYYDHIGDAAIRELRQQQNISWYHQQTQYYLLQQLLDNHDLAKDQEQQVALLKKGSVDPFSAVQATLKVMQ